MATFLQRICQKRRAKQANAKKLATQEPGPKQPISQHLSPTMDSVPLENSSQTLTSEAHTWQILATHQIPSETGNERLAMSYVAKTVQAFHLSEQRLEQLGTAVAEATMNAMEHGNHYDPEIPVTLQIRSSDKALAIRISDKGGNGKWPALEKYETTDIEAKLAELQSPRGWGLFLIQNMVDEMHVFSDAETHTIELILYLEGDTK